MVHGEKMTQISWKGNDTKSYRQSLEVNRIMGLSSGKEKCQSERYRRADT